VKLGAYSWFMRGLESGRSVARDGDVVDDRDAKKGFDVHVVGVRLERVPEEHDRIDSSLGNRGADLLVSAERAAEEPVDGKLQLLGDQ
jgi:hypothetical protein